MYLMKEGRDPLLGFLRNLPSQAIILSMAFVVSSDSSLFGWFLVLSFLAIWYIAAIANISLFFESFSMLFKPVNRAMRLLKLRGLKCIYIPVTKARLIWRFRRMAFLEFVFVVGVVELGMVAMYILARVSSATYIQLIN